MFISSRRRLCAGMRSFCAIGGHLCAESGKECALQLVLCAERAKLCAEAYLDHSSALDDVGMGLLKMGHLLESKVDVKTI